MKEWYIRVNRKTEGPFTLFDLLRDPRVTLDTLAWKPGMSDWRPICQIPELKELFERKEGKVEEEGRLLKKRKLPVANDVITLDSPPPSYLFIILLLVLIFMILYFIL